MWYSNIIGAHSHTNLNCNLWPFCPINTQSRKMAVSKNKIPIPSPKVMPAAILERKTVFFPHLLDKIIWSVFLTCSSENTLDKHMIIAKISIIFSPWNSWSIFSHPWSYPYTKGLLHRLKYIPIYYKIAITMKKSSLLLRNKLFSLFVISSSKIISATI